jgi:hypothetical protein
LLHQESEESSSIVSVKHSMITENGSYAFDVNNILNQNGDSLFLEIYGSQNYIQEIEFLSSDLGKGNLQFWPGEDQPVNTFIFSEHEKSRGIEELGILKQGYGLLDRVSAQSRCPSGNGFYCGGNLPGHGYKQDDLYKCEDGVHTFQKTCEKGCNYSPPRQNDFCKDPTSPTGREDPGWPCIPDCKKASGSCFAHASGNCYFSGNLGCNPDQCGGGCSDTSKSRCSNGAWVKGGIAVAPPVAPETSVENLAAGKLVSEGCTLQQLIDFIDSNYEGRSHNIEIDKKVIYPIFPVDGEYIVVLNAVEGVSEEQSITFKCGSVEEADSIRYQWIAIEQTVENIGDPCGGDGWVYLGDDFDGKGPTCAKAEPSDHTGGSIICDAFYKYIESDGTSQDFVICGSSESHTVGSFTCLISMDDGLPRCIKKTPETVGNSCVSGSAKAPYGDKDITYNGPHGHIVTVPGSALFEYRFICQDGLWEFHECNLSAGIYGDNQTRRIVPNGEPGQTVIKEGDECIITHTEEPITDGERCNLGYLEITVRESCGETRQEICQEACKQEVGVYRAYLPFVARDSGQGHKREEFDIKGLEKDILRMDRIFGLVQSVKAQTDDHISFTEGGVYDIEGIDYGEVEIMQQPGIDEYQIAFFEDGNGNGIKDYDEPFVDHTQIKLDKKLDIFEVSLEPGWNLVSFPYINEEIKTVKDLMVYINDKKDGYATQIATYIGGNWRVYSQREDYQFANDFPIMPTAAYFIKSYRNTSLRIRGYRSQSKLEIRLNNGWNLIGLGNFEKDYTAKILLDEFELQQVRADTLSKWDRGLYANYVRQQGIDYGNDFRIFPVSGYFVKVGDRTNVFYP